MIERSPVKRNSLFEIYRFLFAIWVMFEHNVFLINNTGSGYFGKAQYGIDFFFILTGFFLIKSFTKYYDKDSKTKGCLKMVFDRLKNLGSGLCFPLMQLLTLFSLV